MEGIQSKFGLIVPNIILGRAGDVIVPDRIGHRYKPIRMHDMEQLYSTYLNHRRMMVFANKGLNCQYCEKSGIYLISAVDRFGTIHIDIYTKDFELMTIDHVIPKSKGGLDRLNNLVPSCNRCNTKKGSKLLINQ